HRTEGHQNIRADDIGTDLAVMIDQMNSYLRKRRPQSRTVLLCGLFRHCQKNEQTGHRATLSNRSGTSDSCQLVSESCTTFHSGPASKESISCHLGSWHLLLPLVHSAFPGHCMSSLCENA